MNSNVYKKCLKFWWPTPLWPSTHLHQPLINDRSLKIQVVSDILLWLTKFKKMKVIANYLWYLYWSENSGDLNVFNSQQSLITLGTLWTICVFCRHGSLYFGISVFISDKERQHILHSIAAFFNWSLVICVNIHICLYWYSGLGKALHIHSQTLWSQ